MTSAQVLPNQALSSRKQEHLEAGKRRLEEFRKKKAEGRGKKAASTGQLQSTDVTQFEKLSQEIENTRFLDSSGVTYERDGISGTVSSGTAVTYGSTSVNSSQSTERGFSNGTHAASPILSDNYDAFYDNSVHKPASDPESRWFDGSRFPGPAYTYYDRWREEKNNELSNYPETERELANGITTDRPVALDSVHKIRNINGDIHQSNFYPKSDVQSEENRISSMEHSVEDQGMSNVSVTSILPDQSGSALVQSTVDLARTSATHNESALYNDSTHPSTSVRKFAYVGGKNRDFDHAMILDEGKKKLSGSIYHHPDLELAPESFSTDSRMNFKSFFNQSPVHSTVSETGSRSRLSFLESLNVPRVSSVSHFPYAEPSKSETFMAFKSSKVHSEDFLSSSASQEPFTDSDSMGPFSKLRTSDFTGTYEPSASVNNDGELLRWRVKDDSIQQKNEFPSLKKGDDFAALEQHIEDLTQEKFSLQRALEASRTLAESLAAENSSLTDSFNQQGAVFNQLKSDMERLQEEIRAQLLEIEDVKMEYTNAQLECNAADERAKILASEVIGLEEKALRLRSSELKLERQLESSTAEITSYKRKVSSLEKERQDLQHTIDALQEEKKLLQSKLRKASANGKAVDTSKTLAIMKDVSISTEDLGVEVLNLVDGESSAADAISSNVSNEPPELMSSNMSSFQLAPESRQVHLPYASDTIPPDQLRTISNINSLISELALEKEDLKQALAVEAATGSKLKDLNKELSQKLEAQTQRLELLTAQCMANENNPSKPADSHSILDSQEYADEGDEVVERVLSWIMKLFPGGPAKRRSSKLL